MDFDDIKIGISVLNLKSDPICIPLGSMMKIEAALSSVIYLTYIIQKFP